MRNFLLLLRRRQLYTQKRFLPGGDHYWTAIYGQPPRWNSTANCPPGLLLKQAEGRSKSELDNLGSVALLMDGDNVSPKAIPAIIAAVGRFGKIHVSRIYLSEHKAKLWQQELLRHSVEPVIVPREAAGLKDPADLMLALDAAETCFRSSSTSTIAVASEDVDFAILLRRLREWGCSAWAVVPDHGRVTQSHQALQEASDVLITYALQTTTNRAKVVLDTHKLDISADIIDMPDRETILSPEESERQLEDLNKFLRRYGYLPDLPQRGVMRAALAKFFHVHGLGRVTLWPLSDGLAEAFQAISRPQPSGGWMVNPGDLVFMQPRWTGRQTSNFTANFTRFAFGGPHLTRYSENMVQRVLHRLGYLEGDNLREAVELFCMLNRKELQTCSIHETDGLSDILLNLGRVFAEQHQLQAWRVSYDDSGVRNYLKKSGWLHCTTASKEQAREAMQNFLVQKNILGSQDSLPTSYAALTASCLRYIGRHDPNNRS
eukprot:TRINITY_DN16362_c0_g1_i1.p1 TRINITY_DN16362_c0_g1~~TRINITY_DN16362_c0_g1_i1.p1  ORF type:complete len:489 (-),score=58.53 TRINITY_DN16362_c0_g1_i1:100-1566(-)